MPKRVTLTPDLAWAAATDAGNRAMRKRCSKAWSAEDYNAAVREYNRLFEHITWPETGPTIGSQE